MPITCHYLSSIRLWNSWKVCRITITRWPLWPSITFITFGSLCSSVPFITISTSNTTVNFITFGTLRTGVSFVTFWTLTTNISLRSSSMVTFRTLRPSTTTTRWPLSTSITLGASCISISFVTLISPSLCASVSPFWPLSPLPLFWTNIALFNFWSLLPSWSFNTFQSCTYFAMISNKYTIIKYFSIIFHYKHNQ